MAVSLGEGAPSFSDFSPHQKMVLVFMAGLMGGSLLFALSISNVALNDMDTFLTAFWPNVAATLVGIVVGLPSALWINRLALQNTERSNLRSQTQRLTLSLQVLVAALEANSHRLGAYTQVISNSKASWDLNLDTSVWEVTKIDVVSELTPPDLRRQLAFHFTSLGVLCNLNDQYLSFMVGTNASMSNAGNTRGSIQRRMEALCKELQTDSLVLAEQCKATQKSLLPLGCCGKGA